MTASGCGALQDVSEADAPALIAKEQATTHGAAEPLLLDSQAGLRAARRLLDGLASDRGIVFTRHTLQLSVGARRPLASRAPRARLLPPLRGLAARRRRVLASAPR